ncbi:MAG: diacylglycerol/polyprenol kinase family protein [Burkholderiales bacterium]
MNPWIAIALVLAVLTSSMVLLSAGRYALSAEARRKLLHVEMGLVALGFPWLFAAAWPVLLLAGLALAWFGLLRACSRLQAWCGPVLEASGRGSIGAIWFVCGVCLTFLLSNGDAVAYCTAIMVLTLADTAAALVGQRLGRARKSVEGSLAFFCVAFAVAFVMLQALAAALLVALVTTAIEALLGRGLDNLFVPLGALAALGFA